MPVGDRVARGDKFKPSAAQANAISSAVTAGKRSRTTTAVTKKHRRLDPYEVWIINKTETNLTAFSIVEISTMPVPPTPEKPNALPLFEGIEPTGDVLKPLAIVTHAIKQGGTGKAIVQGVVPCQIDVTHSSHYSARPVQGETEKMESSFIGPAQILWRENRTGPEADTFESGVESALVMLGQAAVQSQWSRVELTEDMGATTDNVAACKLIDYINEAVDVHDDFALYNPAASGNFGTAFLGGDGNWHFTTLQMSQAAYGWKQLDDFDDDVTDTAAVHPFGPYGGADFFPRYASVDESGNNVTFHVAGLYLLTVSHTTFSYNPGAIIRSEIYQNDDASGFYVESGMTEGEYVGSPTFHAGNHGLLTIEVDDEVAVYSHVSTGDAADVVGLWGTLHWLFLTQTGQAF